MSQAVHHVSPNQTPENIAYDTILNDIYGGTMLQEQAFINIKNYMNDQSEDACRDLFAHPDIRNFIRTRLLIAFENENLENQDAILELLTQIVDICPDDVISDTLDTELLDAIAARISKRIETGMDAEQILNDFILPLTNTCNAYLLSYIYDKTDISTFTKENMNEWAQSKDQDRLHSVYYNYQLSLIDTGNKNLIIEQLGSDQVGNFCEQFQQRRQELDQSNRIEWFTRYFLPILHTSLSNAHCFQQELHSPSALNILSTVIDDLIDSKHALLDQFMQFDFRSIIESGDQILVLKSLTPAFLKALFNSTDSQSHYEKLMSLENAQIDTHLLVDHANLTMPVLRSAMAETLYPDTYKPLFYNFIQPILAVQNPTFNELLIHDHAIAILNRELASYREHANDSEKIFALANIVLPLINLNLERLNEKVIDPFKETIALWIAKEEISTNFGNSQLTRLNAFLQPASPEQDTAFNKPLAESKENLLKHLEVSMIQKTKSEANDIDTGSSEKKISSPRKRQKMSVK